MLQAFNSANKFGDMKVRIETAEFEDFWEGAHIMLEKELPTMDMKVKTRVFKNTGMGFSSVSLVIAAVLRGSIGEKGQKQAEAFLELAMFACDPFAQFDDDDATDDRVQFIHQLISKGLSQHVIKATGKASKFADGETLLAHLHELKGKAVQTESGPKSVPDEHFKELARAMMSVELEVWHKLTSDK